MQAAPQAIIPFFGGFVLETLTIGMYGESRNAIREYIQNAFDGIENAVAHEILQPGQGLIEVVMHPDQNGVTFRDNGSGIGQARATRTLTQIGASTKDYRTNAGFRGIGRLAGIVFSDTVEFTTKARGEAAQTRVVFNGRRMRELMAPAKGSASSAEEVLMECITAFVEPAPNAGNHFFEVTLRGFDGAPPECKEFIAMEEFISQVAPVRYHETFPFTNEIYEAAARYGLPIEEVRITLQVGDSEPVEVTKPFRAAHETTKGIAALVRFEEFPGSDLDQGPRSTKSWWGWFAQKDLPAAYKDRSVAGLRVRMKNIQIDGTDVMRQVFHERAKSHVRFQDWIVGEIFVDPSAVVPNARRDGFEETPDWQRIRKELGEVARRVGAESYVLSKESQLGTDALRTKVEEKLEEFQALQRKAFRDPG